MSRDQYGLAYQKGFRRTVAVLRRRGASPELAEEIAQQAWARGWARLAQLKDAERLVEWVNTIAVNLLTDEVHRRRRFTELSPAVADVRIAAAPNLGGIDLRRALQRCSPVERELIQTVVLYEDRTVTEVAAQLRTSVNAIHHRLSRSRRTLRKVMLAPEPRPGRTEPLGLS
jgi:RNA polymerase sigma factor (sigma-70 family)